MKELTGIEIDTISEVGNISLGASATALSVILNHEVDITTPRINIVRAANIKRKYPIPCLLVEVEYTSGLKGSNVLIIKEHDALVIAALMLDQPIDDLKGPINEIELSALQEAMNQMMGSMATSMSELFQRSIDISPPKIKPIDLAEESTTLNGIENDDQVVHVEFSIVVGEVLNSVMIQVIPVDFAKDMAGFLLRGESETASASEDKKGSESEAVSEPKMNEIDQDQINESIEKQEAENVFTKVELNDLEKDTLAEVGNICLGASATTLATILDKAVDITTPRLSIVQAGEIASKHPVPCLKVDVKYTTGIEGSNLLLVKEDDAMAIASMMIGEFEQEKEVVLDEIGLSAVQEAMNQMMGSMATSMSELFQRTIEISPTNLELINLSEGLTVVEGLEADEEVVYIEFSITVEDVIDSVMIQVIPLQFAKNMAGYLLKTEHADEEETIKTTDHDEIIQQPVISDEVEEKIVAEEVAGQKKDQVTASVDYATKRSEDQKQSDPIDLQKLDMVRDIPMDITVILGSTKLPLGKLFSLDRGSVVDLDRLNNEPVEILTNNRLLAKGEIVMVNDQLGIRITEIQLEELIESGM